MTCERRATTVCSECRAVCFCSIACQRKEYECGGPSSHGNLCAQWKVQSMRDVSVQLTSAPDWQATCVQHGGRMGDRCALLRRIGCHFGPYKLCCECTSDDATWITYYADGGGHTRTPSSQPHPKDIRLPITCQRSKITCWRPQASLPCVARVSTMASATGDAAEEASTDAEVGDAAEEAITDYT